MGIELRSRNYGLDILRVLSMFMIVLYHVYVHMGIISHVEVGTTQYTVAWIVEIILYCGVDCFALLTGYLMYQRKVQYSSLVTRWIQVFIYSILFTVLYQLVFPGYLNQTEWMNAFLPVFRKEYWYFSAYFGLCFLIPFMNAGLSKLSKNEKRILVFGLFLIFSISQVFYANDSFALTGGYHVIWLAILYVYGALIKESRLSWNKFICLIVFVISTACTVFVTIVNNTGGNIPLLLQSYTSPTVLLSAISLFMLLKDVNVKNTFIQKVVEWLSPLTFGIYLISDHPVIRNRVLSGRFAFLVNYNPLVMVLGSIVVALGIYFVCAVIDWVRLKVFDVLHISSLSNKICNLLGKLIGVTHEES